MQLHGNRTNLRQMQEQEIEVVGQKPDHCANDLRSPWRALWMQFVPKGANFFEKAVTVIG
jgi:hypothetical protein